MEVGAADGAHFQFGCSEDDIGEFRHVTGRIN